MSTHPYAGKPAPKDLLIDAGRLVAAFYEEKPDPADPNQLVSFGTSGHRGTSSNATFTEAHILAITQAICEYRRNQGITGPLFMGKDTHALSRPAERVALEVLAANGVETFIQRDDGFTPTPVISHCILGYNRGRSERLGDGIVITPSHNPPTDGGFKYNPPNGGPADTDVTDWIQNRANDLLRASQKGVQHIGFDAALKASTTHAERLCHCLRGRPCKCDRPGSHPLSGFEDRYRSAWRRSCGLLASRWWSVISIDITIVNPKIDPTFAFMTVDHDGKIRMDCSSPWAMAGLVQLKDRFDIAFGNDPDADRHGIVTPSSGLLNPNHYLAVAIRYLLTNRPQWPLTAVVGKTLVSSCLIDRVVASLERKLWEVPVGFKWFTPGLFDGSCCFGGEESAGASFLKHDGSVWTTDKDGLILGLLAAEITARTGKDPGEHYKELTAKFGTPYYTRIDAPATPEQKNSLKKLSPEAVTATELAGEAITAKLTRAPGNNASDRRVESRLGERLVCRPPVRDREYLQTLRGKS